MIVCHKHKFIFLKTSKTAGTSVEIALSRFCGPKDIITEKTTEEERKKAAISGRKAQNYLLPLAEYGAKDCYRLLRYRRRARKYINHMTGTRIRAVLGSRIWDNYFKFCIERHPYDRCISHYAWKYKDDPNPPSFKTYLNTESYKLKGRGYYLYSDDGHVLVDKICRFENLQNELNSVTRNLGIEEEVSLPKSKSGFRDRFPDLKAELLSEDIKSDISVLFSEELDLMGYKT